MTDPVEANGNGKTAQSYIAGIGASGALLAGAVVTFVFLVGTVSFEVWPQAAELDNGTESLGVAELNGPAPAGSPTSATLGETVTILASTVPTEVDAPDAPKADGGVTGDGGSNQDSGGTDTPVTPGGGQGTAGGEPGGGSGGSGDENPPSDRPTNRPSTGGSGSTGGGTATAPPATGGENPGSDRPSSGGRG